MKLTSRSWKASIDAVGAGWSGRAAADLDELRPLLRSRPSAEDLRAAGAQLGGRGHALADVLSWFQLLAARNRRAGRGMSGPDAVTAISSGWAAGAIDAAVSSTDETGLNEVVTGNSPGRHDPRPNHDLHSLAS